MKKHISIILALLILAGILAMPAQALAISSDPEVGGGITATGTFTGSVTRESSVTGSWCDITAGNLSLDAMCYIYFGYATTAEMEDVDDYGVIFWTAEQEDGGYTYLNATKTGSGALIRSKADGWSDSTDTYFNYGVSMKQMTDLVWGQGYYIKGDTVYTSSKVVEYSVQTYAGNKLGILNGGKNETSNQKLKTLLKSLLQTGAAAQEYLDYKTYDLASDILYWSEGLEYYSYGDGTCCVYGIGTCNDTELFIPRFSPDGDEVIEINYEAFAESNIESVVIPTSVIYIGDEAFAGCASLADIRVHDNIEWIGSAAFDDTAFYNDDANWTDNALYLGNYLVAAKNSDTLTELAIKDGTTVMADGVFAGFTALKTLNIPASLRTISYYAFYNCSGLTNINIAEGSQLQYISSYAFYDCRTLETIDLSGASELQYIDECAFYCCTALNSIKLPDSLTYICSDAFDNTGYYNNSENWSGELLYIGNYFIKTTDNYLETALTIAEGTLLLADGCFDNIYSSITTSLTLPSTLKTYISGSLNGLGLKNIAVTEGDNARFYALNNCLIDKTTSTVLFGTDSATIPNDSSITAIGEYAFSDSKMTAITIPDNIKVIGAYAFEGSNIESITLGSGITEIEEATFAYCEQLTSITIPDNVTSIGYGAFMSSGLKSITIPSSVTKISNAVFSNTQLTSIYYEGSEEQWNSINKLSGWDSNCNTYTITYDYTIPTN